MAIRIPEDLANMARERRVIPFLGAGFSAAVGLPGWSDLLRTVATELRVDEQEPTLTYEEIVEAANGDYLRVAEYLYLRAGSNIGPLRHYVTKALQTDEALSTSTAHVELVNVGAPQVYTTNFDDLVERSYHELRQKVRTVVLPRDLAAGASDGTEVVKYHGDLSYDQTLVLTERQYWRRLDFESPMDLKFRSDLLGRSVLFIGYSFSDINIRVIWFKLMEMMRDVPLEDRPISYMVRFEPNPVLEALFRDVGLRTIVLDPEGKANSPEDKSALLGEFLEALALSASDDDLIPGTTERMFLSRGFLNSLGADLDKLGEARFSVGRAGPAVMQRLPRLPARQVPQALKGDALDVLSKVANASSTATRRFAPQLIVWAHSVWGSLPQATELAVRALLSDFSRHLLLRDHDVNWGHVWEAEISADAATAVLRTAERELLSHEAGSVAPGDVDLAYAIDLLKRFEEGLTSDADLQAAAKALVERASQIYASASEYEPPPNQPPDPTEIIDEIHERFPEEDEEEYEEAEDDEILF